MTSCLALLLLLGASTLASEQEPEPAASALRHVECSSPFHEIGGRCMYVELVTAGTWEEMREVCRGLGGDLAILNGDAYAELISYIHGHGLPERNFWIGATDLEHEGVWLWVDGSPVQMGTPFWGYQCQGPHFPDGQEQENCAFLNMEHNLYFDDYNCDSKGFGYPICEA